VNKVPVDAAPAAPLRFSSDALASPQRRNALGALREHGLLPIEPLPDHEPRVELTKWFSPSATLLAGSLDGVRQRAPAGDDATFIALNLRGTARVIQSGTETVLGQGDGIVLSASVDAFCLERREPGRFLGLRLAGPPATSVNDRRFMPRANPAVSLLTAYLSAVAQQGALSSPALARVIVGHTVTLVDLALGAQIGEDTRPSVRAARLAAIKSDIAANLTDHDALRLSTLAARHGVTPRYVHKLFELEGVSYSRFVLQARLKLARNLLHNRARSISTIAFDAGFGDLSYFNRTFRSTFGITPSELRTTFEPPPT
jgi:AraC-like DNA-binding protein